MNKYHYLNENKCKCGKFITNNAKRCSHCSKKEHWKRKSYQIQFTDELNLNYKHGRYIEHKCIDCEKQITTLYERCKSCSKKGELSKSWKGGKPKCIDCGKQLSHYGKRCNNCAKIYHKGKNHHCWIDGLSKKPYSKEFNKQLKNEIRERDSYVCQNCGITEKEHLLYYNAKLVIHHIDYNKMNCNKYNLISLCFCCNTQANGNRDYWFAYYTYIIEEKFNEN